MVSFFAFSGPSNAHKNTAALAFVENEGQWKGPFEYSAYFKGGRVYIQEDAITYHFWEKQKLADYHHKKRPPGQLQAHALKMAFPGAKSAKTINRSYPSPVKYNYFKGSNPNRWATNVRAYQKLELTSLYPGIHLEVKGTAKGLKYSFKVEPGSNPKNAKIQYEGADSMYLQEGNLHIKTALNTLVEQKPVAYQNGQEIPVQFELVDSTVSFGFPQEYDPNQKLVIDPKVIFATYSGSQADNFGFTGTHDDQGHAYSGGTVYSKEFPTTTGSYQLDFAGGDSINARIGDIERDAGILKYSPDGSQLLYATYLGGSSNEQPHSMVVNNNGELLIYGSTLSEDFPVTGNAHDTSKNGNADIFISKLSADGSTLLNATFLGGGDDDGLNGEYRGDAYGDYFNLTPLGYNYGDLYRGEIITDSMNNVYIASSTRSGLIATPNAAYSSYQGGYQDGCVFKLNPDLSNVIWGTYLGGSNHDAAYSLVLDANENVYVTGGTRSSDFGGINNGLNNSFLGGNADGYVIQLRSDGTKVNYGTYIGTQDYDQSFFVKTNQKGEVYITGQTEGDYPVTDAAYQDPNSGQFISKLSPTLDKLLVSTTFGTSKGSPDLAPSAFMVDICGNVYFSGWGGRTNNGSRGEGTSTQGLPVTPNAFQSNTDGSDFYVATFRRGLDTLLYATYLGGGKSDEHVDGGTSRFKKSGVVYQSVCGGCGGNSDFPVTSNAWSETNNSSNCNNAFFKLELDVANAAPKTPDTTITVIATDEINYPLPVNDPQPWDSINLNYTGRIFDSTEISGQTASIERKTGKGQFNAELNWQTVCEHARQDTFTVNIELNDNGCPQPKRNEAIIQIVVEPPPKYDAPEAFCSEIIDENTFELTWSNIAAGPYLSHYEVVRAHPDGRKEILDSIFDPSVGTFTDYEATNLQQETYCYYLRTVNACGKTGDSTYQICTGPDYQQEPTEVDMLYATVINDQYVKVKWEPSKAKDFSYYILQRKRNNTDQAWQDYEVISEQTDSVFMDRKLNVDEHSYCYRVLVADLCGFYSDPGNEGCTILLQGESEPFEHNLAWNDYRKWPVGVEEYTIYRRDPLMDTTFKPIARVDGNQTQYLDEELNYEVGAYWYQVKATEKQKPKNKTTSESQSNEIYLVQSPLLHVPNAFTNNGDGINDSWGIRPVFVKNIHIQVFNRWGTKVFDSKDKDQDWSGWVHNQGNEPASDRVFIYIITYTGWDGTKKTVEGNVTMLK